MKEVRNLLEEMSKKHNVPTDRIMIGFIQDQLYVWDYSAGRHYSEQFKVLEIINP